MIWTLLGADFSQAPSRDIWRQPAVWLFILGWMVLPTGLAILWRWNLAFNFDIRLSLAVCMTTQALAWTGRYLPGKAGLWLAKLGITVDLAQNRKRLGHSVLAEQLLFLMTGMILAAVLMPWHVVLSLPEVVSTVPDAFLQFGKSVWWLPLLAVLFFLVFVAMFVVFIALGKKLGGMVGWWSAPHWMLLAAGHGILHVLVGLSLYPLIVVLLPSAAETLGVSGVIAALALGNCVGILAIFAPAGLGVREVVLALCLSENIGFPGALSVAVFLRLLTLLADAGFALLAWSLGSLWQRFYLSS